MSEPELVELFVVIDPTLRAAIKAVYKMRCPERIQSTEMCSLGERFL